MPVFPQPQSERAYERPPLGGVARKGIGLVFVASAATAAAGGWLTWRLLPVNPEALAALLWLDAGCVALFTASAWLFAARVLRPLRDLSLATQRLAEGVVDVEIRESNARDEIGMLTQSFNAMLRTQRAQREEIETANTNLVEQNASLERANEVLGQLSITDGLTKLHNHRFFQDHLSHEIHRVERNPQSLSMLLLDLDNFKRLNDRHGHAAGDEILARIARILNDRVRATDLCARYGGEEFVILTPATNTDGAYRLAEEIRTVIAESSFILEDSTRPLRATISIGVATYDGDRKRFFQKADQALYRAKANGKNCTVVHADDWPDERGAQPD